MTTLLAFAALSAFVYNDQRGAGPGDRPKANELVLPTSWTPLSRTAAGFPAQSNDDDNFFSFTAGAYVNQGTGEFLMSGQRHTDFKLPLLTM